LTRGKSIVPNHVYLSICQNSYMLETYICQLGHGVGFDRHIILP